ncbi:bacterioferritin [Nisaea acidiphila]|uniref:Bacterioferritin n=1 Tax=Nisaea acidiphila TaxID=1862145 RepID=A0A9J7ATN3_9PROT|nr:bacterioferritin [Nisaea acidiphila]UUX50704.1 bacterioferritin [Nisaea acidiphila]
MAKKKTLTNLQKALSMELTAAHQYQLHAHVLEDWGIDLMAAKMREEMQEELGHSDAFIERIMFLKGDAEIKFYKSPARAQSLNDMFQADLDDEKEAIRFYTEAAAQAQEDGDIGSRVLFEKIALDEEGHMSWLELQLDLISRMGEPAYIAKHVSVPGGEEG